ELNSRIQGGWRYDDREKLAVFLNVLNHRAAFLLRADSLFNVSMFPRQALHDARPKVVNHSFQRMLPTRLPGAFLQALTPTLGTQRLDDGPAARYRVRRRQEAVRV